MKKLMMASFLLMLALVNVNAQRIVERYAFQGTLDGKTAVRLAWEVNADGVAAGHIYYPNAKNPAPIMIIGSKRSDHYFILNEYQNDGEITGYLALKINNGKLSGEWNNPRTEKELHFTNMRSMAFPKGYGGLLVPENPGNLGHYYCYQEYHTGMKELMGGNVKLIAAGKNRVHFEVSNVFGNIAEGKSEKGRPAVLKGNKFTYNHVNECDYGFKATFFTKFTVLESTTGYETRSCFGANIAFDAVYIKVKD